MRTLLPLVLALAQAFSLAQMARAQNGASITVGDEVVFSGGPSQPPRSIQTGFQLEVNSIRGGGGPDAPRRGRKSKGDPTTALGGAGAATTAATPGDLSAGQSTAALTPGAPDGEAASSGAAAAVGAGGAAPGATAAGPPSADLAATRPAAPDFSRLSIDDLAAALGDRETARRQAAVAALGAHAAAADRAVVRPALESALTDSEPRVVQQAAEALARLGDPAAAPAVMKLVYDRDDGVAVSAIRAVSALGYKVAVPELTKLAGRDQGPVGHAALEAAADLSRPPRSLPIAPKKLTEPRLDP